MTIAQYFATMTMDKGDWNILVTIILTLVILSLFRTAFK